MNRGTTLDERTRKSVLEWAAERRADITISLLREGRWCCLRSRFIRFDPARELLQIAYPITGGNGLTPEIAPDDQLGIAFRRGHKKCIFVGRVVMRSSDAAENGQPLPSIVLRIANEIRELQRRVYQRVVVPQDCFIAVKLWEGGPPSPDETCWPLCAGRLRNVSVGGVLVEIRADQNPRLSVGDAVGVEITPAPGHDPLVAEGQYRHCCLEGQDRLGLGLQFIGLEHDLPGRTSITQIANFVRSLQRGETRCGRNGGD